MIIWRCKPTKNPTIFSADLLPYFVVYAPLCQSFIKWPNVFFCSLTLLALDFGSPDPLFEMFTVIVLGYLQQAHCSIHFLVLKNNKQTAKRMTAKSGKTVTVTDEPNHLSSSSNSPHLSLSLSRSVHLSYPPISLPSVSLSMRQGSICSICMFWLCVSICMHVHFVIVSQWVHVGHTVHV